MRGAVQPGGADAVALSVVVPLYCSGGLVAALLERLRAVLDGLGRTWEVVLVDDGSADDTWDAVLRAAAAQPAGTVRAVRLMRNFGQHNALMCGFRHARGSVVVTLDDDLQNPPEEIPKLLAALEAGGYDVVYGRPAVKKHASYRNAGSMVVRAFYRRVFRNGVTISSFRALRREVVSCILSYDLNFTFVDGLLAWSTQRIGEVAVEHQPRRVGRSGYSVGKLLTLAFNLFTNFTLLPLQVVALAGVALACGGFAVGVYYLVAYFRGEIAVLGYASIITAVLVLGGAQLVSFGVFGEYLGRLHLNVNRKPQYLERERREFGDGAAAPRGVTGAGGDSPG